MKTRHRHLVRVKRNRERLRPRAEEARFGGIEVGREYEVRASEEALRQGVFPIRARITSIVSDKVFFTVSLPNGQKGHIERSLGEFRELLI